ncbi:MAG: heavy-metal-associated domain-containing protein [Candidatus Altiarchaeota archaeon]
MDEIKIKVEGMHCGSCEMLVKDELSEVEGVRKVEADHKKGLVTVKYEGKLDLHKVKKAIAGLGYKVKE